MRQFLKQRIRVLLVCTNPQVQSQLVSMLTGFEFYVDYVDNVNDALVRFKSYRHPVVLIDESLLGATPQRLLDLFRLVQRDCLVLAIAPAGQSHEVLQRVEHGLFDILETPINPVDLRFRVRRLLKQHANKSSLNYMRVMFLVAMFLSPLLFLLAWYRQAC